LALEVVFAVPLKQRYSTAHQWYSDENKPIDPSKMIADFLSSSIQMLPIIMYTRAQIAAVEK